MPDYQNGDFVLILRSPFCITRFKSGDLIIFSHPFYGLLIKRIHEILPNGDLYVIGNLENSLDSRKLGYIPNANVIGKVIWSFKRKKYS